MDNKSESKTGQPEEEKKTSQLQEEDVADFEIDMSGFVEEDNSKDGVEGNILFFEEDNLSTQLHNQESNTVPNKEGGEKEERKKENVEVFKLDIMAQIKEQNKYEATDKNITLYRVLQDNKKSLDRKFIPLLDMFKVEVAYFKALQHDCVTSVNEKIELENSYKGKIKLSKKEALDF